jgi:ACT domain-containing protein
MTRNNWEYVCKEYHHTWSRHGGKVTVAAVVLDMKPESLARALMRARAKGINIRMIDDTRRGK